MGLTGCLERFRRHARAYTCCTRDDRYDNPRKRTHTLAHCAQETDSARRVSQKSGCGPVVPFFLSAGPFLLFLRPCELSIAGSPDAYERKRGGLLLLRGRSVTEIVYISLNLYHRAISPSAPPLPPSPPFVSPRGLFFFLFSPSLSSRGSLSGLSLPFGDRYRARARARA